MKAFRLFLYVLLAAALTSAILLLVHLVTTSSVPKGTQALPYQFSVSDYPGIDAGTDLFRLGALTPDSMSYRLLSITDTLSTASPSSASTLKRVRIVAVGDGHQWLHIVPDVTDVPAVVNISVSVPQGAAKGVYKGTLLVMPVKNE